VEDANSDNFALPSYVNRSVLVTGGAGFIGSHLVEALLARGASVSVIDDLTSGSLANLERVSSDIRFVEGSILDTSVLEESMEAAEVVFHHAALVSVPESMEDPESYNRVNVDGTRSVLEAAGRHGVARVIFAGSCSAYGDLPGLPKNEDDPVAPTSPYAQTKLDGEELVASFASDGGLDTARFRYFNVYGPRQAHDSPYAAVIPKFRQALSMGEEAVVFGDGLQTRDFVHVHDVVFANLLAAMHPAPLAGEVFNIGSGIRISILEILEAVAASLDVPVQVRHEAARPGEVRDSQASIELACSTFGYQPSCSLEESLAEMHDTVG
jgi:UDP-glucose 4-epimerase